MPRAPRFIHPLRQVRTCLGHTQAAFAKLLGCSTIAVQRIENGTLKFSPRLANMALEAVGANPAALLKGKAWDMDGKPYTKKSFKKFKALVSCVDNQTHYRDTIHRWLELLLIASERAGQDKTGALVVSIGKVLKKLAVDFNLEKNIFGFLRERNMVKKRSYQVRDLRKFPVYAQYIGFKDNKRYGPKKLVSFEIPKGWIDDGFVILDESPVLPKKLEKLHRGKFYLIDGDRPVPKEIQDLIAHALYWRIKRVMVQFGEDVQP